MLKRIAARRKKNEPSRNPAAGGEEFFSSPAGRDVPLELRVLLLVDGGAVDTAGKLKTLLRELEEFGWGASNRVEPHPLLLERAPARPEVGSAATNSSRRRLLAYLENWQDADYVPNPFFDQAYYLERNPDVAASGINPLAHFVAYGEAEGRMPNPAFDPHWYLRKNPDVGDAGWDAVSHFLEHGFREGRNPHPLFDIEFYTANAAAQPIDANPVVDYLLTRNDDKRSPHPLLDFEVLRRQLPRGCDPLRALMEHRPFLQPNRLFDCEYYRQDAGLESDEHPLLHFVEQPLGDWAADPHPSFCVQAYRAHYPDAEGINALYHFLRWGESEGRNAFSRLPHGARRAIDKLRRIDPQVAGEKDLTAAFPVVVPPRTTTSVYRLLKRAFRRPVAPTRFLVFLSGFRRGGAELEALNFARTIHQAEPGSVAVIVTDPVVPEAREWWARIAGLPIYELEISELAGGWEARIEALARVVSILAPEQLWNCNSFTGWEFFRRYGPGLSKSIRFNAFLFCYDYREDGVPVGYAPDYLRDCIQYLARIHVDNRAFVNQLVADFGLPAALSSKFELVYQPYKLLRRIVSEQRVLENLGGQDLAPRVLWAGRFARQKRPDILLAIAEASPDFEFHLWGGALEREAIPDNVVCHGEFKEFFDLPLENYCAYLHTAEWEGLPNALIDAGSAGLPCVAPDVGGISELATPETAYLIAPFSDVSGYVEALTRMRAHPEDAVKMRTRMLERIEDHHHPGKYAGRILELVRRQNPAAGEPST